MHANCLLSLTISGTLFCFFSEMGSIYILVSAVRIVQYFCIDIGIDLVHHECIVHRYRFSRFFVYRRYKYLDTGLRS